MSPQTTHQAERAELDWRRRDLDRVLEDPRLAAHGDLALRIRLALTAERTFVDGELARRERLLHVARRVRRLQQAYFRFRDQVHLAAAKEAERELDALLEPQLSLPIPAAEEGTS